MADDFEVIGQIVVDDQGNVSIQNLNDQLNQIPASAGNAGSAVSSLATGFVMGIGEAAVGAIGSAIGAIGQLAGSILEAGEAHEMVMAQMKNVLDNAKGAYADTQAQAKQFSDTTGDLITVTAGSSKEIAKAEKGLKSAQEQMDRANASWSDHAKHTNASSVALEQHSNKLAEAQAKYDALTKKVQVHAGSQINLKYSIDQNAAALHWSEDRLDNYADSLSRVTMYSKEQYLQAETMTLQYDKIGKDIFPEVIQASANLAARTGVDLVTANNMLTRALGDPAMGIGRLNQQFKLFEPTQLKAIEQMAKHGKTAEAQQLIIDALNTKMGGAAKAAGDTFAGKMAILGNKFDEVKQKVADALMPALSNLMDKVGPVFQDLLSTVGSIITDRVIPAFTGIVNGVTGLVTWLTNSKHPLDDIINALKGALQPILDSVTKGLNDMSASITDFINKGAEMIRNIISGIQQHGGEILSNLGKSITDAVTGVSNFIGDFIAKGQAIVTNIVTGIQDFFAHPADKITDLLTHIIASILKFASSFIGQGQEIVDHIVTGIQQLLTDPAGKMDDLIMGVMKSITDFLGTFITKGQEIVDHIVTGIANFFANPGKKISDMLNSVIQTARGFIDQFIQAGTDFIQGIIDGIKKKIDEVIKSVEDLANRALAKIKEILHIGSPSRVMIDVGYNVVKGLALGIGDNAHLATDAMGNLASGLAGAVSNDNSQRSTVNNYYFGASIYDPQQNEAQALAQSFRKS